MLFIWILCGLLAAVCLPIVVLVILGKGVPKDHVSSVSVLISATPEAVYDRVSDVPSHAKWAEGITSVHVLPDHGNTRRHEIVMGRNRFEVDSIVTHRPLCFTMSVADKNDAFHGQWEYRLTPEGSGTRVVLTEHGVIKGSIPRAAVHYMFGYYVYLEKNLRALGRSFGMADTNLTIEKVK
jgi:uncharacterized protein YndB with AHSA1/START domain